MNYIKSLETKVKDLELQISNAKQEIQEFRSHLAGAKFTGIDLDGSRKDWISTSDVNARLLNIYHHLLNDSQDWEVKEHE